MRRVNAARGNTSMDERLKSVSYDEENKRWVIKARSNKAIRYYVQWSAVLGKYTCTCPDWRYRRMGRDTDCKHIHCITEILQYGSKEELEAIGVKK